ncbi:putative P-loop containing nucleoside triphosphate hydrolase, leucine-rich repeat domain, L [Rosa chinensis]|uniref:Putative P-loop containing nucleoside triphosphate hydrolase, leucine-rich repeat domain, L n=1 Tax=Rosa chinensis TaxID=74649 RepID=A0A2P6SDP5_ROSCH|nr:probable disease resistance RPP8-like protein 2 [Rosa chinensis]PRQ56793.1 putative P-loop containing nucleoside triphosphate hydrolase, leucine-rich repeat domain, L [Rosa chinensis]
MAKAAVSILLGDLTKFIAEENQLLKLKGVKDQFEQAQRVLRQIQAVLKDAGSKQEEDKEIGGWMSDVRDAVYNLEEVVQEFFFEAASKNRENSMKIVLKKLARFPKDGNKIGSRIESITAVLTELISRTPSTDGGGATSAERERDPRQTTPSVREGDVVGVQGDIKMLVERLVNEENCHQVVSIWGMGGLGKTTLAKMVYNDPGVRNHFSYFAWVCISQKYQERDVLGEILDQLNSGDVQQRRDFTNTTTHELADQLHTALQAKTCLVVLDDIWNHEVWQSLRDVVPPVTETKSRILVTTRNTQVVSLPNVNTSLYEARLLSDTESWELFEKRANFGGENTGSNYEIKRTLGETMLKRCAGLPAAIILLAGLLAQKNTASDWNAVHDGVVKYLWRDTAFNSPVSVFERSYRDLPFRLQPCFLYLAQFPEDYEISTKRLTQLWMAEGLISSEGLVPSESEETMEDVSYRLLDEMVERSMVQVGGHGSTRMIKTCRLHRLMRDMCLMKAKEENFLQVQDLSAATFVQAAPINKVRRLSVYLKGEVDELAPTRTESNGHLKSLLYFVQENFYSERSKNLLVSLLKDFKMLSVLKFEDMKAEPEVELPSVVGNLVLLRFLSLKNSEIKRIPSSVANLVFLQTLDIRCAEWVSVEVPDVFGEMSQLRHLYLPLNHRATAKLSLANLSNLQTLVNLSSEDCNLNDILKLTSLRKLVINAPRSTDLTNLGEFMRSKDISFDRHLHSLSLMAGNGTGDITMEVVSRCPQLRKLRLNGRIKELQDKFLCSYLTKVTLEQTHLEGYDIERLEKLENLKLLTLRMDAIKSGTMVFSQRGFPSLQFLSLIGLSELKEWKVEKGAMPSLSKLHIEYCWGLKVLPEGLQYISSLKELTIKRMYHEFCSRLGEEGEDFYKIKHVPSVTNLQ